LKKDFDWLEDRPEWVAIRVTSRMAGIWELDILEEAWSYVTRIKILDEWPV